MEDLPADWDVNGDARIKGAEREKTFIYDPLGSLLITANGKVWTECIPLFDEADQDEQNLGGALAAAITTACTVIIIIWGVYAFYSLKRSYAREHLLSFMEDDGTILDLGRARNRKLRKEVRLMSMSSSRIRLKKRKKREAPAGEELGEELGNEQEEEDSM